MIRPCIAELKGVRPDNSADKAACGDASSIKFKRTSFEYPHRTKSSTEIDQENTVFCMYATEEWQEIIEFVPSRLV
jgi:hypothetical protein